MAVSEIEQSDWSEVVIVQYSGYMLADKLFFRHTCL